MRQYLSYAVGVLLGLGLIAGLEYLRLNYNNSIVEQLSWIYRLR